MTSLMKHYLLVGIVVCAVSPICILGQTVNPITKDNFLSAIRLGKKEKKTAARFVQLIKQSKVDFVLTEKDEQILRREGSYLGKQGLDELVSAVRNNYYRSEISSTKSLEVPEISSPPKINGKVKYGRLTTDAKAGYLYLAVRIDLTNTGGRTKIRGFRTEFSDDRGKTFQATETSCSDFRLSGGSPNAQTVLSPTIQEKKNEFFDYGDYRDGWLCLSVAGVQLFAEPQYHYETTRNLKISAIDSFNTEHPLGLYERFPSARERLSEDLLQGINERLIRIGQP